MGAINKNRTTIRILTIQGNLSDVGVNHFEVKRHFFTAAFLSTSKMNPYTLFYKTSKFRPRLGVPNISPI